MDEAPSTHPSLLIRLRDPADEPAWFEFIKIYGPLVRRLALWRGLQEADAEDLAQEVFRAVARAIERYDPDPDRGSFRGWLSRIARNLIINLLAGIWATPPFLHNGAVLNLYELLSPVAERSKTFNLGTTLFDPVKVGYDPTPIPGGFELDTALPGNSNLGHEFRDLTVEELKTVPEIGRFDPLNLHKATIDAFSVPRIKRDHPFKGVIGPAFSSDERYDLIEYLKSM